MNAKDFQNKMHEALDAAADDAPQVAAHLERHPEDRAVCEQFDRLETMLRSRRAGVGESSADDVGRVMRRVRQHELSVWTGRFVIAAAAAALLAAVVLPLLQLGPDARGPLGSPEIAERFEGYIDAAEDPLREAEFVLAVVQDRSGEAALPVAFGQIVVRSDDRESAEFFKGGRRVKPEVLADELVRGRMTLSNPQGVFDAVARTSSEETP